MKSTLLSLDFFRPVRFLIAAFVCTILFFGSAFPAVAATSSPTQGEASLNQVQKETDKFSTKSPRERQPRSVQETAADAKGLNAVQGRADKEKMNTPEDSQDANSVEDMVKSGYQKVFGN
ncbi:hypothetical protein [Lusitaniella coriacea]|uniref:hypothetical protein n=1 Tax=Lusitaniella coriacea TaxID=1983105 RepID=UPI003CE8C946